MKDRTITEKQMLERSLQTERTFLRMFEGMSKKDYRTLQFIESTKKEIIRKEELLRGMEK